MKTSISKAIGAVLMLTTAVLFPACDLLENADDVSFSAILEDDFSVSLSNEGTNVAYTETISVDATAQDSDIDKYANKITGFKINKIIYKVASFDGVTSSTFSGDISFSDIDGNTPTVAGSVTGLNLHDAYVAGTEFELELDPDDVKAVQKLLKMDKAVKIYFIGTFSQTPVYVTLRVTLDVNVEADAL